MKMSGGCLGFLTVLALALAGCMVALADAAGAINLEKMFTGQGSYSPVIDGYVRSDMWPNVEPEIGDAFRTVSEFSFFRIEGGEIKDMGTVRCGFPHC